MLDQKGIDMTPQEAKTILDFLADGVNPETGEVLSGQNLYNQPRIIRALFLASSALEVRTRKEMKKKGLPANAGKPWSEEEDNRLLAAYDGGLPIPELAEAHGRTRSAISSRLVKFGRLEEDAAVSRRA
jgi:hypothetical protein